MTNLFTHVTVPFTRHVQIVPFWCLMTRRSNSVPRNTDSQNCTPMSRDETFEASPKKTQNLQHQQLRSPTQAVTPKVKVQHSTRQRTSSIAPLHLKRFQMFPAYWCSHCLCANVCRVVQSLSFLSAHFARVHTFLQPKHRTM